MFTDLELDTRVVSIGKVATPVPAGTATVAGTAATDGLLLDRETTAPPTGAGPLNITDPLVVSPPTIVEGLMETDDSDGGFTVRVEDFETPPYRPEMVTAVETDTGKVVIAKVALMAPVATVTDDGTVATEGLPLDSDTTAPPARAGASSVTVPVDPFPPTTVEGLRESESRTRGITDRLVDLVTPPYKEEMLTAVEADTGKGGIAKVELLAPTATVTAEGTI